MGPSAIRLANLQARLSVLGYEVEDLGNIETPEQETIPEGDLRAKYLDAIAETCHRLSEKVASVVAAGRLPIVLGGDHSIAPGTVSGVAGNRKIGVIWIDAHGDINTPQTSPSGNVHGMPLAALLGREPSALLPGKSVAPSKVALVGVRDLDPGEQRHLREWGVRTLTMRDIDERGMRSVMEEAIGVATKRTAGFHLSLDMDVLDPNIAPGVGTPVEGGLSYREAHLAMELIHDSGKLLSLEIVEVNPVLDVGNRTANLAVELAMSAMGKKIL